MITLDLDNDRHARKAMAVYIESIAEENPAIAAAMSGYLQAVERRIFWRDVNQAADEASKLPRWKLAGVDINPKHFETYK